MASLNFDVEKIKKEAIKDALKAMKQKFTKDINRLARPYGERPKITFKRKGSKRFEAKVEVDSDELTAKIDDYLKKEGR